MVRSSRLTSSRGPARIPARRNEYGEGLHLMVQAFAMSVVFSAVLYGDQDDIMAIEGTAAITVMTTTGSTRQPMTVESPTSPLGHRGQRARPGRVVDQVVR
ncbi:hypothetical protein ACFWVM_33605 [Nocardia fluminea]|uniref:hypothetical protein n=1 Tax=Nocardia fluminea TaxID=134984 RepID=UPI003648A42C